MLLRRLYESLKNIWLLALRERATPRGIAGAVAVGVFIGCTPFVGFHAGIALVVATVFRLSRLWTVIGSRVSFLPVLFFIVLAEIQAGHRVRTGEWASLSVSTASSYANEWRSVSASVALDWGLGAIAVGGALALVFGAIAYALAKRRDALTPRMPAPAPPPVSESPP